MHASLLQMKSTRATCSIPAPRTEGGKNRKVTHLSVYAPPAWVLLHDLHFQIPTACRLTENCDTTQRSATIAAESPGDCRVLKPALIKTRGPFGKQRNKVPSNRVLYLAAERAKVLGMLADFCLLNLLTKTGSVSGSIFANNADLFGALRLQHTKASYSLYRHLAVYIR